MRSSKPDKASTSVPPELRRIAVQSGTRTSANTIPAAATAAIASIAACEARKVVGSRSTDGAITITTMANNSNSAGTVWRGVIRTCGDYIATNVKAFKEGVGRITT